MNELQIFNNPEFGEIRAIDIDGEAWFVGGDVARALGYAKPRNAISNSVDADDARLEGVTDSLGRIQQTTVINESGVYSLIILSTLPSARKFKRWVTSEVLPALRKEGTYTVQPMTTAEQLVAQAQLLVDMEKKLNAVAERMETAETIALEAGNKAEQAVQKLDTAIKVYSRPDKDHWIEDMSAAIHDLAAADGFGEIRLRGKLYAELEKAHGHLNVDARLKRLRERRRAAGATHAEAMALNKLDAIAANKELRLIFEGIVKQHQAQAGGEDHA